MKIGVCTNMSPPASRSPRYTGIEHTGLFARAGFDYIELPGAAIMSYPEEERRRLEKEALSHGIPCRVVSSFFPATLRLTGGNVDKAAVDNYIDEACAMAARLGVTYLVFGSSDARNAPMGFPKEKALEQIADTARRLADRAGRDGMSVVIEHINRFEGNMVETFRESVQLTEKLNHPHIRGFVDYYHLGLGNENFDLLGKKISSIEHAHVANLVGRTIPVTNRHEEEEVEFLKLMKKSGYEGGMSVEGFTSDMNEFLDCAAFLKRFA